MSHSNHFRPQRRVILAGSEKANISQLPPALAATAAPPPSNPEKVTVTVIVRRKRAIEHAALADRKLRLRRSDFAAQYGADPESIRLVEAFAQEFGLQVATSAEETRSVKLTGTEAQLEEAFGVTLSHQQVQGKTFRHREGSISLPAELEGHVTAVLGLDNRPQARPHNRAAVPHATNVSYTPVQVASLYSYPANPSAAGQTIGILELGGGFSQTDLETYFQGLGLPVPHVAAVSVDGGTNSPGDPNGADGEVMLDIEVSAAVAPGANIAVYFAPNTDQGFIDAVSTAVHDATNKPSVLSISWGGPESTWTAQSVAALDEACQSAAVLGVTITVAAGDSGSTDGVSDGANHVDFPASSPHVLACGGTTLEGSGSTIQSEVVWNELALNEGATGGGVSNLFPLPTWQANAGVPAPTTSAGGRGVPDVAGDADPSTGYNVLVDGQQQVIGGTSAVAPLWAGLIALANQANGDDSGFINPTLYAAAAASAFHDITQGNNPAFSAGPGWDACTGLGSPIGTAIIQALAPSSTTAPTPTPTPAPTPTPTPAPTPTPTPAPTPTHHHHHHHQEDSET
jgi:kumamolisin